MHPHTNLPIFCIAHFWWSTRYQKSDHIYYTLLQQVHSFAAPFISLSKMRKSAGAKPFSWAKPSYLSSSDFNVQGHILSTCRFALTPALDWSHVLIGPGDLLLVGSDLLLSQVHVCGWGLESVNKYSLMRAIQLQGQMLSMGGALL
jgi:hypothetical protein